MGSYVHTSNWHMQPIAYVAGLLDRDLEALSFQINEPAKIPLQEIKDGFDAMPPQLKRLYIETHFTEMIEEAMLAMTARFPKTLTTVGLHFEQFRKLPAESYAKLLSSLHSGVDTLSLENHHLSEYNPKDLQKIMLGINKDVSRIELGRDNFRKFLSYLPDHIKTVQLQFNLNLWSQDGKSLSEHFNTLKPSVEELSLKHNSLNCINVNELVKAFKSIPTHIQKLDLSHCNLSSLSVSDFKKIMNAIPWHVKEIKHANNGNISKQSANTSFFQPATKAADAENEDKMEIAYK